MEYNCITLLKTDTDGAFYEFAERLKETVRDKRGREEKSRVGRHEDEISMNHQPCKPLHSFSSPLPPPTDSAADSHAHKHLGAELFVSKIRTISHKLRR